MLWIFHSQGKTQEGGKSPRASLDVAARIEVPVPGRNKPLIIQPTTSNFTN
jgi:hypothetical protein